MPPSAGSARTDPRASCQTSSAMRDVRPSLALLGLIHRLGTSGAGAQAEIRQDRHRVSESLSNYITDSPTASKSVFVWCCFLNCLRSHSSLRGVIRLMNMEILLRGWEGVRWDLGCFPETLMLTSWLSSSATCRSDGQLGFKTDPRASANAGSAQPSPGLGSQGSAGAGTGGQLVPEDQLGWFLLKRRRAGAQGST